MTERERREFEQDEFRRSCEAQRRRRQYTPDKIVEIARNDHLVATLLDAWRKGYFSSWEEMLIALACELSRQNARLLETAVSAEMLRQTKAVYIAKQFSDEPEPGA